MCTACYALRNIKHIEPIDTLRVIYFAHIHAIINYGIIFGGSSSYANKVFILQKKIIRIISNTKPRDSCREAFKSMEILTLYSQNIYSLVLYTINNKHLFDTNKEFHKYKTRNNTNLHFPIANLSKFNKGAYISGIKVFNHLPQYINPYPTAFPYENGMVLHFYQQQESSTTKTVHKVINKGLKAYV